MTLRSVSQFKGALDVQLRAASTAVPTTPTQLILPTLVTQVGGIGYDTGTGIYTAPVAGTYDTIINFNVMAAAARTYYFYTEISLNGGPFNPNTYSARQVNVNAASDGQIIMGSTNFFPANTAFKFYFWVTGGASTMQSVNVPGTTPGTIIVPASRIMITGV